MAKRGPVINAKVTSKVIPHIENLGQREPSPTYFISRLCNILVLVQLTFDSLHGHFNWSPQRAIHKLCIHNDNGTMKVK